jgi:colanic acid/amylovoran biosynthesis glycosyltransferase
MVKVDICSYDKPGDCGGPAMWLQRIPLELRSRGYAVRVRLFSWKDPLEGSAYNVLREQGVEVTTTLFSDTVSNILWLLRQVSEDPPDVFVANHVVPALYAGSFIKRWGIPTVGVFRSDDAFYHALTDVFVGGAKESRLAAVVCVSEFLRESVSLRARGQLSVTRIPSGTPVPESRVMRADGRLRMAYVGRFVEEQKRASDLTRAICRAVAEVPLVDAVFIGEGPARPAMESIIRDSGEANVRILGQLDAAAVREELLQSHVIVLLSDFEGTPTAVMEAMACGCVPVCLRIRSGVGELVEDGVTGILVDDRNDGFVGAIRRLKNDGVLWDALSRQARERVQIDFSTSICADKWSSLIDELAGNRRQETAMRIPNRIPLPPVHPALARQDVRLPGGWRKAVTEMKKWRFHAGKLKRSVMRMKKI